MREKTTQMRDLAMQYWKRGFSVIPVKPDGSKVPYILWAEFQERRSLEHEITKWWAKWPDALVGIVTGKISGICVIDIDDPNTQEIWGLLPDPAIIPTSKTSRGLHLYFGYPQAGVYPNNTGVVPGCDFRGEGGYVVAYEWLPGQSIFEVEPPELPTKYLQYIKNAGVSYQPKIPNATISGGETFIPEGQRDERLFHLANRLFRGGASVEEVREHLMIFANQCEPPFPAKELEAKIQSALKRDTTRTGVLSEDIRAWINSTNGYFSLFDCEKALIAVNKKEKDLIRQVTHQLTEKGVLERHRNKNGYFRRIETDFPMMDLTKPRKKPLDLLWPFDIQNLYHCYSKNIVVIAGSPDVGKSAFCMNFAMLNRNIFKVNYFSSEMGEDELQLRLGKFDIDFSEWLKINWIPLSGDYADAIRPDEINIIDFMEIHEDFWRVGGWINEIFRKLNTGMCLIALQKPTSRDVAKGGEGTLEKPRLYMAMDHGKIKIVKCKNWASETNPNRLSREFKIVQGCNFKPESDWSIPWEGDIK